PEAHPREDEEPAEGRGTGDAVDDAGEDLDEAGAHDLLAEVHGEVPVPELAGQVSTDAAVCVGVRASVVHVEGDDVAGHRSEQLEPEGPPRELRDPGVVLGGRSTAEQRDAQDDEPDRYRERRPEVI